MIKREKMDGLDKSVGQKFAVSHLEKSVGPQIYFVEYEGVELQSWLLGLL